MEVSRIFSVMLSALMIAGFIGSPIANSADLTPEQIESIKAKLKAIKEDLDSHLSSRNSGAGQVFAEAASDPRKAVALYAKCVKLVKYEQEGRPSSDFKQWEDQQADLFRDSAFTDSLQMQLRYLALSCQAAEAEKIDAVFGALLSYVDSLSRMEEMPTNNLTGSVAGSVFSRAYKLEKLLGANKEWEPVPLNISGIYSKTILPHLRREKPEGLMNAWDKRIEQETRIVAMIEEAQKKEMRGLSQDEQRKKRDDMEETERKQRGRGGPLSRFDKNDFITKTLPLMKWEKLKDMYKHIDQVAGAKAMLDFVGEHLQHEFGERFFNDFQGMINSAAGPSETPAGASN